MTQTNVIHNACSQNFSFRTLNAFKQLKSCTVFIRSAASFFELTYMLQQNNCVNRGVTNSLKQKKEKNHAKQRYMLKPMRGERRGMNG